MTSTSPSGARRVTTSRELHLSDEKAKAEAQSATADLVRRASSGDNDALERLLVDAQSLAWRFSMTVCGHPEDAEDAMQEALVRTYRHVPQIRDPDAFRPWLYRTVRNACLMSRRRRVAEPKTMVSLDDLLPSPNSAAPIDAPSPLPTPEDAVSHTRLRRSLTRAMGKLPPTFRAVVFLRDMEGLSTRETASTLGISEDNVKARLHRARLFLRKELVAWNTALDARPAPRRSARTRKGAPA